MFFQAKKNITPLVHLLRKLLNVLFCCLDDLSALADQTRDFAANTDMARSVTVPKVHEPIGTRPVRTRFSANPNWDFPSASPDR